jgi:hypothetical protein
MGLEFAGRGLPMTAPGFAECAETLGVHAAEVWAVLTVETRGCGFLPDHRPLILFERHIFHRETGGRHDAVAPDISQPTMGGYGGGGARQFERLARAIALDRRAALRSASWGIGQVMGFNAERAGFRSAEDMVTAMRDAEDVQLRAMVGEIVTGNLHRSLRAHDWASFARGYNGASFAVNQYDTRLAAAYQRFALGLLPDLTVRAAQIHRLPGKGGGAGLGKPGRADPRAVARARGRRLSAVASPAHADGVYRRAITDSAKSSTTRYCRFSGG